MKIDKMAVVNLDKMKYNEQGNDLFQNENGIWKNGFSGYKGRVKAEDV